MSLYLNLKKGVLSSANLVDASTNLNSIVSQDRKSDWYRSVFYYDESHKEQLEREGTLKGIQNVYTDNIFLDFDSENDLETARIDTIGAVNFLVEQGLDREAFKIYFSGNKGFSVEFKVKTKLTNTEYRRFIRQIVKKFKTADSKVCDPQRVFRIENTRNLKSGLYKIPLDQQEIVSLSIDEIKHMAKQPRIRPRRTVITEIPQELKEAPETEKKQKTTLVAQDVESLDFNLKPSHLTNCRWAIQNGFFKQGERNFALLCLAATWKNQGMPKEVTYRILKGAAELQSQRTGDERYSDSEIYNNIVEEVYSPFWRGGQFTCQDDTSPLHEYCAGLGDHSCEKEKHEDFFVKSNGMSTFFEDYVHNFDKNVLKTGVEVLDEKCSLMVGTSNGFVGPPSCGKTSLALQILNHNSLQGINSIFFSFDMFHSLLYTRMLQRHTGIAMKELYRRFREEPGFKEECVSIINQNYEHVDFCFKNGLTPDDIDLSIRKREEKLGEKVKLVMIDYNELLVSRHADSTAASAEIAQKLRQIANERQVCLVTLLQPSKFMSNPAEPITSFNAAKGSGAIPQSVTLMLGFSRPGYNPQDMTYDKYFNITCLKNRIGPLFSVNMGWNGLKGEFSTLSPGEVNELKQFLQHKEEIEKSRKGGFNV